MNLNKWSKGGHVRYYINNHPFDGKPYISLPDGVPAIRGAREPEKTLITVKPSLVQ